MLANIRMKGEYAYMKKVKSRKGMTLVEIIVTVAIISIVSGMGIGIFASTITNYSTASVLSKEQSQALEIEEYIKSYARLATNVEFISPDMMPDSGVIGAYISNKKNTQIINVFNYDGTSTTDSMFVDNVDHIDMELKRYQLESDTPGEQDFIYLYYKIVMKDGYSIESSVLMNNMKPEDFGYGDTGHVISGGSFTIGGKTTNTAAVFKMA